MNTPEWLSQHRGSVAQGPDGRTWYVVFEKEPQYRLVPVPAKGRLGCAITQTINGKRIPSENLADSSDGAIQAGLEDLGKYLGWC